MGKGGRDGILMCWMMDESLWRLRGVAWGQEEVADLCRPVARLPFQPGAEQRALHEASEFVPTTFTCLQVALLVPESH